LREKRRELLKKYRCCGFSYIYIVAFLEGEGMGGRDF
jgi:hypothetical protein